MLPHPSGLLDGQMDERIHGKGLRGLREWMADFPETWRDTGIGLFSYRWPR